MPASKATYLIIWEKSSQVYSAATLDTAVKTPPPKGCGPEDKRILLASFLPDDKEFCVFPLTEDQIEQKVSEINDKEKLKNEQEE